MSKWLVIDLFSAMKENLRECFDIDLGAVGSPGKVMVALRSVKAVDDQEILLRGCVDGEGEAKVGLSVVLGLLCLPLLSLKGGDAVVPAGTEVRAYTEAEYVVTVASSEPSNLGTSNDVAAQGEKATAVTFDKVYLKSGKVIEGRIKLMREDAVEFLEKESEISCSYTKVMVDSIKTSLGKLVTF